MVGYLDRVIAFNIPVKDMESASRFYREVFGWGIRRVPDSPEYLRADTVQTDENGPVERGAINGGIFRKGTHGVDVEFIEVLVDSIDRTMEKAFARGGRIIRPRKKVNLVNDLAIIQDQEGNFIGLWEEHML